MTSETLNSPTQTTTATSTLYLHQKNRTFGGTLYFGDPAVSGHVITVSVTKKNNFCTITIDMFRESGIYFNFNPSLAGPGHIPIATLPVGYRPNDTVYAVGQGTTTDVAAITAITCGGFQVGTDGNIYQRCPDYSYDVFNPSTSFKRIFGIINYTIDGTNYTEDGI